MRRHGLLVLLLAACTGDARAGAPSTTTLVAANAVVVHVADGDTIDVRVGDTTERVRLIGIDTPETHKPDTPVQCHGPEATAFTEALLPAGTAVRLERDIEPRDPYGRLLAYVYRAGDGVFVNVELARGGFARRLSIAPNDAHGEELSAAVSDARAARRGLWGACEGAAGSAVSVAAGGG